MNSEGIVAKVDPQGPAKRRKVWVLPITRYENNPDYHFDNQGDAQRALDRICATEGLPPEHPTSRMV